MSTPLERLTKIANAREPALVKFKRLPGETRTDKITLQCEIVKSSKLTETLEDKKLYNLLSSQIEERWDDTQDKFAVTASAESLWNYMLNCLVHKYETDSSRCAATKRKTIDFIRKIKLDDKLLSEFIMQAFIHVFSKNYLDLDDQGRATYLEQFNSLRRTFGKRVQ